MNWVSTANIGFWCIFQLYNSYFNPVFDCTSVLFVQLLPPFAVGWTGSYQTQSLFLQSISLYQIGSRHNQAVAADRKYCFWKLTAKPLIRVKKLSELAPKTCCKLSNICFMDFVRNKGIEYIVLRWSSLITKFDFR